VSRTNRRLESCNPNRETPTPPTPKPTDRRPVRYCYEIAPSAHRAFVSVIGWCGVPLGLILGTSVVLALQAACTPAQMAAWGWRVAFLLGALTGVLGVVLRRTMPDPAVFLEAKHEVEERLAAEDAAEGAAAAAAAAEAGAAGGGGGGGGAGGGAGGGGGGGGLVRELSAKASGALSRTLSASGGGRRRAARHAHYWPVAAMLRHHWRPVLLQFAWEFWFAGGRVPWFVFLPWILFATARAARLVEPPTSPAARQTTIPYLRRNPPPPPRLPRPRF
jgi:hypothetical protein